MPIFAGEDEDIQTVLVRSGYSSIKNENRDDFSC